MLSAHEITTLTLIRRYPEQTDMNRAEPETFLVRRLMMKKRSVNGHCLRAHDGN